MRAQRSSRDNTSVEVLTDLGRRYQRFQVRNRNYARLLTFLCFVALFLATLYLQRNAHVSFQVYSTVANGMLPDPATIDTTDDIYSFLEGLLQSVWQDPVCGDGVCEVPFEYAAYGRFGCRADCGRLQDIQNLTAVQIDLYYDFNHPSGSIPATELMNQASWNLCPQTGTGGCYWAEDQAFSRLAGSLTQVIPDVPDGEWALVIKRDIFNKVRGAIRIVPLLEEQALHAKVSIALEAAAAVQANETAALQQAIAVAEEDLVPLLNATFLQHYQDGLDSAATEVASGVLSAAQYSSEIQALQQDYGSLVQQLQDVADACPPLGLNVSGSLLPAPCLDALEPLANLTADMRQSQLDAMRSIINLRLVPLRSLSNDIVAAGLQQLMASAPEVYAVAAAAYGTDGAEPSQASISTLAEYYVEGPRNSPPPAKAALSGRLIASSDMTSGALAARAQARIDELDAAAAAVLLLPEVNETLAGGTVSYNFVDWDGGTDAFESCDMESRTPQYVGACSAATPCSSAQGVDGQGKTQVQYSCPATVLDNDACGDQCDMQQLCTALCTCTPGCDAGQVCVCPACTKIASARTDPDYLAMEALAVAQTSAAAEWVIEAVGGARRGLKATSTSTMLDSILSAIAQLEDSQAALAEDVQQLGTQVQAANAAEADAVLETLISNGQQQILQGQSRIQTLLGEIIGKQNAAAAASAATAQALANLQTLQQQQLQAQQQLEQASRDKVEAIKAALQQGYLTLSQALEMYRQARVQSLVSSKSAVLATEPCTSQTAVEHGFEVDQYNEVVLHTSRVRQLGLTNRVLAGLLLFAQRDVYSNCTGTRFSDIDNRCDGGLDLSPYGVDPVFKLGTSLYDPDLDGSPMLEYYNCSALPSPAYNLTADDGQGQRIVNAPPYCADLFNPRNLPYGFHSVRLDRLGAGFPAVLDINLSQDDVLNWLGFLREGLFLGSLTRSLMAQLVTYNTDLRLFSASTIAFDFSSSGSVKVNYKIETLRVELYATGTDKLRLFMELALVLCIAYMVWVEGHGLYQAMRRSRNPLSYFRDGWHMVDFVSTALLVATACMWISILVAAARFDIALRYDVYEDLQAQAAFLTLADDGKGLQAMHNAFGSLQDLSNSLSWYYALSGINLLLLISRMLQLMDFQPRLGVVTRSLAHAGPDLLHFCLVFSLVFVGYAMLAHLIFGNGIEGFSSFGGSVETCFAILLGDISVNDDLKALTGLQAAAGALFFWSYEILVFLVLLNFLLAIIVDVFGDVKSRTTDTTGIQTEIAQVLAHLYQSALGRMRGTHVDDSTLGHLLGDWDSKAGPSQGASTSGRGSSSEDGGGVGEGDQKRLYVAGKEVTEEQLKSILQANMLHELDEQEDLESPAPSPRRLSCSPLAQLFHARQGSPSRRVLKGPAADADQVAHYVMLRFGEGPRAGEAAAATSDQPAAAEKQQAPPPPQQEAEFSIAAVRGKAAGAEGPAGPGGGGGGLVQRRGQNGALVAGRIRAEAEQSGLHCTLSSLLELHAGLRETQQQVLRLQQQLAAQQAGILQAVQPAEGGGAEQSELGHPSSRGETVRRSAAARGAAPGAQPPARP